MKRIIYLLVASFLLTMSCSNDDNTTNPLSETGLIGTWGINGKGINNVSSIEAICCETLIFSEDSNIRDFNGNYEFDQSVGVTTNGTFVVDTLNNTILFTTENGLTSSLEFSLVNDILEVWFFNDSGRNWTSYNKL